jgi:hypothetical protein
MGSNAKDHYERLLRAQLRPDEVLDGIFAAGPELTIAITSERLLTAEAASPNGWELKSIPWALLTEAATEARTDSSSDESICLRYTRSGKASSRRVAPRIVDSDAMVSEEEPKSDPLIELILVFPPGSQGARLLRARLLETTPK